MKKLLFVFVIGFVAAWQLKGNMGITPDNQLHLAGLTMPVPAAVRSSPVYALVTTMMLPNQPAPAQTGARGRAGGADYPTVPVVSSLNGSYNGNLPSGGAANGAGGGADPLSAAAKAIRGSQ